MGKVKGLMMQMEEDACWMAKEAWIYLYGESYEKLYSPSQDSMIPAAFSVTTNPGTPS